jgi:putative membrane protein
MMWISLLVLLAFFAMFYGRIFRGDGSTSGWNGMRHDFRDPIEILKQRYAKGEIGKEEYEEMKRKLQSP